MKSILYFYDNHKIKDKLSGMAMVVFLLGLMIFFYLTPVVILAAEGGDAEIQQLSQEIKDKQDEIEELRQKIEAYQTNLEIERSKANSLKNQVYILDTQIEKKQAEITLNEEELAETNLQIQKTKQEIEATAGDIGDKQNKLAKFLREIYRQDQKTDLEIVIMNESIADFFNYLKVTEEIQSKLNDNLILLKDLKSSLEEKQADLTSQKEKLDELNKSLLSVKGSLEDQQYTKQFYLTQTKNSEKQYQNLVEELKAEQTKINAEIVALEKVIRQRLSGNARFAELGNATFIWPTPGRTITAYFHDPDYPFRYIFEHPAIDIRASQGTPLKAAASGYVAKVQNGGRSGYSYIMLIHTDGFSTVYGHVSAIYVETDQYVNQGEIIGKTGGMPGTPGAGNLTTGPHLHFEIRKDGIPVNPLDYLP